MTWSSSLQSWYSIWFFSSSALTLTVVVLDMKVSHNVQDVLYGGHPCVWSYLGLGREKSSTLLNYFSVIWV